MSAYVPFYGRASASVRANSQRFVGSDCPSVTRRFEVVVRLGAALLLLCGAVLTRPGVAQVAPQPDILQLGGAVLPGIGFQIGYVEAGPAFTREAFAYVDVAPRFGSNREELQVSAGLGAGIRVIGTLETLTLITPRVWDFHLGFRFGPGLNFAAEETRSDKNQRFSLFLEPFGRFTVAPKGEQIYFLEGGINRPYLRLGVWLAI
ncbi:MAG: hypothetical protein KJO98_11785 [Rhodothermia bacterium]|nr:hypothetical protein [Rhodothermia bacterium]